ncbi:MAG: phospholipase [Lentisphaerales bacterium]|jgi:phosphatidylserine/phosphatidylglycerophosphate/cardiolipin synthase-like enzyme|nr:MAG: phospholipase [Lentisphaerales bacterium]
MTDVQFLRDRELYERVLLSEVPRAERFLWLGTSDLKDLHVDKGSRMVPFLEVISDLVERGVQIRLLHAKEPGPAFREDFDRYPRLLGGIERVLCPRVHFKLIVVDGVFAYTGSANLTGAGIGAKSDDRRNFENGIVTTDPELIGQIMDQFDSIWMGTRCEGCKRKEYCADCRLLLETDGPDPG